MKQWLRVDATGTPCTVPAKRRRAITWRALLLGLLLLPPNFFWILNDELVVGDMVFSHLALQINVVFTLFVVAALNLGLRRLRPRWALSQGELLTVYVTLALGTTMCALDTTSILIPNISYGAYHGTDRVKNALVTWPLVTDIAALKGYYEGRSTLYTSHHIFAWLAPLGRWWVLVLACFAVMTGANALLRRQWTERERLTYPIVQLPLSLSDAAGSLLRDRMMWFGFALAAVPCLLNGLNFWFPEVPRFTLTNASAARNLAEGFTSPWDSFGYLAVFLSPMLVGLGFLMPAELLFSCWFFVMFWRVLRVIAAAFGYVSPAAYWVTTGTPTFPYIQQQMVGGFIGISLYVVWLSRKHLRQSLVDAFRGTPSDDREALSPRAAVGLIAAGGLGALAFGAALGMPLWLSAIFFGLYFVISIGVARIRAQLGAPIHEMDSLGPDQVLPAVIGTRNLPTSALAALTYVQWFNRAQRANPMPHQLESFWLAQRSGTSPRRMLSVTWLALIAGMVLGAWAFLDIAYRLGTFSKMTSWGSRILPSINYARFDQWLSDPSPARPAYGLAILAGTVISIVLMVMSSRLTWWPFHALGFTMGADYSIHLFYWPSLMAAWTIKVTLLRYGGLAGYRRWRPFFFGLILGDVGVGCIFSLIGAVWGIPNYNFSP